MDFNDISIIWDTLRIDPIFSISIIIAVLCYGASIIFKEQKFAFFYVFSAIVMALLFMYAGSRTNKAPDIEKVESIFGQNQEIERMNNLLKTQSNDIKLKGEQIAGLEAENNSLHENIRRLEFEKNGMLSINEHNIAIEKLNAQISVQSDEIKQLKLQLAEKEKQTEYINPEVDEILRQRKIKNSK